ncbi:MAG: hypothetical protein HY936_03115 [Nitrosomonadales bacterium]|nr:hypothetical protein [Nitrosomonadales bacterium]
MNQSTGQIAIYQTDDGQVQLEAALEQETVWLSQAQMVGLFGRNQSVVSRHIRNALAGGEVVEKSNMQKMHIVNSDRLLNLASITGGTARVACFAQVVVMNHSG